MPILSDAPGPSVLVTLFYRVFLFDVTLLLIRLNITKDVFMILVGAIVVVIVSVYVLRSLHMGRPVRMLAFQFSGEVKQTVQCSVIMVKFINHVVIRVNNRVATWTTPEDNTVPLLTVSKVVSVSRI